MKNKFIYLIGGILIGSIIAVIALNSNQNKTLISATSTPNIHAGHDMAVHSSMTMPQMVEALKPLKGDEFDRAFIEMMIEHHQGAIDMAALASDSAKHEEIKDLSKDIIDAQTREIQEMKSWQLRWKY